MGLAGGGPVGIGAEARETNVMQAIATFVPRSEIDKENWAIPEQIDGGEKLIA